MDIDLSFLTTGQGFIIQGDAAGDQAGASVSSAGDINGDGYDDFIVGAPAGDLGADLSGQAYIVFGRDGTTRDNIDLSSLASTDGFVIVGGGINYGVGWSVSDAGDVNGDGYDDLLVGAPFPDGSTGETYVIFGKDGTTRSDIDLGQLDASDGFVVRGIDGYDYSGWSVSSAGDVNGDGFDDIVIGAPFQNGQVGQAYLVFGKDGATRDDVDLGALDSSDGFVIHSAGDAGGFYSGYDYTGWSVSSAGDVNGDGYDDFIVGAPNSDYYSNYRGEAYVIFGKDGATRPDIDLAELGGSDGFTILGAVEQSYAGWSVSSAGDVNGDGYDDLIIGATGAYYADSFPGEAYVIFGKDGATRGDIDLASLSASDGFTIHGAAGDDGTGWSVSSAGDVNGDGYDDMIIGAPRGDNGGNYAGQAYVILGKSGAARNDIDLATLDPADGIVIQGDAAGDKAGWSVSSAGDINGDGFDDIIVGARAGTDGGVDAGEAYVIYGHAGFGSENQAPVALPATAEAIEDGPLVTGQLEASDPDGDELVFSPVLTAGFAPGVAGLSIFADGSYTFDPSDPEYQSLAEGEVMELLGGYFVSDGDLTDSSTLTITITGVNDAPVIDPSVLEFATTAGTPHDFTVSASDIDGDTLIYDADDPDHGTVTGGAGGQFTYTPDAGFLGTDSVTVTVSDGHGGTDMLTLVVTVNPPTASDFRLFASDGYVGEIGGSGQVFGTAGFQDIAVLDEAGIVAFDPSFNKGGDIVRLSGNAGDWQVVQSGSSALFSDGDTFVQLPIGTAGTAVVFDDGVRSLRFDAGAGSLKIGAQSFGTELVQITAPTDGSPLPTGADEDASARLFLGPDKSAVAGGHLDVFGTSGAEQLTVTQGAITLDPSFNKGGDTLVLGDPAPDFLASRSGSTVLLDGSATDVVIPVGLVGMTIAFPGDDERTLLFDTMLGNPVIGTQEIDTTPTALVAFG